MWEPQPLTTLRASKACRGENFTLPFLCFQKGELYLYFFKQFCYSSFCLEQLVQVFQFVLRKHFTRIRFWEPLESRQYCVAVLRVWARSITSCVHLKPWAFRLVKFLWYIFYKPVTCYWWEIRHCILCKDSSDLLLHFICWKFCVACVSIENFVTGLNCDFVLNKLF
jgi:hypothetical protein